MSGKEFARAHLTILGHGNRVWMKPPPHALSTEALSAITSPCHTADRSRGGFLQQSPVARQKTNKQKDNLDLLNSTSSVLLEACYDSCFMRTRKK